MTNADELLAAVVLRKYREDREGRDDHLASCPDTVARDVSGENGTYGCDTGCEYYKLTATLKCPHEELDWEYGDFGDIAGLIEDMEAEATRQIPELPPRYVLARLDGVPVTLEPGGTISVQYRQEFHRE